MKFLICFSVCILLMGCRKEDFQKVDADTLAEKELQTINFKEVDRFPLFKTCDETASRQSQQSCFEQNLHQWLKPYLDTLKLQQTQNDTLKLVLNINKQGDIQLDSISSETNLFKTFKGIFKNAPQVYPAQKRGIPVSVKLELPIILNVKPN